MCGWCEKQKQDLGEYVDYFEFADISKNPEILQQYKIFLLVLIFDGHDEWIVRTENCLKLTISLYSNSLIMNSITRNNHHVPINIPCSGLVNIQIFIGQSGNINIYSHHISSILINLIT